MAGAQINITATVTVDAPELKALQERLAAPSDLSHRIGEYMQEAIQRRFSDQRAPDGTPWQELDPAYAKRKKYNRDKVLTLRGYLRRSIRYQPNLSGPDSAVIGTNLEYAAIHQFGGEIQAPERQGTVRLRSVAGRVLFAKKKQTRGVTAKDVTIKAHTIKIPARPFLGVSDQERVHLADIVRDWLMRGGA
jgi:phage virion morphogenesis protein